MTKVLLLIAAILYLSGCANSPGGHGFNIGSVGVGPRTEVQLRVEKLSAETVSATEERTLEMERKDTGRNMDSTGLGIRGVWRF